MNRYPVWKYLIVLAVLTFGIIYSLPNLYAPDPAIQITGKSVSIKVDEQTLSRATDILKQANIKYFGEVIEDGSVLIRFTNLDDQLKAQRIVGEGLQDDFVVAVNLAPTTPEWLVNLGASPMKLGLDLAGGVHFLLEVDTDSVLAEEMDSIEQQIGKIIREKRLYGVSVSAGKTQVIITADTEEKREEILDAVKDETQSLEFLETEEGSKFIVTGKLTEAYVREKEDYAVKQNLTTLKNRVNELGVAEPIVQRQGRKRIVVQLPGIQDTAWAKNIIGKTANLEFRLEANGSTLASQKQRFKWRDDEEQRLRGDATLLKQTIVKGNNVTNAQAGFDPETSAPQVNITLDSKGAVSMNHNTKGNIGRRMGVIFIEFETRKYTEMEDGVEVTKFTQIPKKRLINLATIQAALGKQFVITGLPSPEEASELALLLRAGALSAPMGFVEERTIGPSLGAENIELGVKSVQLGLALVVIFMIIYYRAFGFAANLALTANLIILVAVMSSLGATLTLPGIAGIVLTVGMAVDANVLIFSRIREELKIGLPPQTAIKTGFDRAFTTILDANLTTLIVAVILYAVGTGPIKGFAVTLAIGIMTSMFTAIMGTRAIVNLGVGGRSVKKLWI